MTPLYDMIPDIHAGNPARLIVMLPEHQPLPGWKHTGSKREGFVAVFCEIRRRDVLGQGLQATENAKDSAVLRGFSWFVRRAS